jgi:two-component system, sensor histidine kinase RegB
MQLPAIFRPLPQHEALGRLIWMRAIALSFEALGVAAAVLWLEVHLPVQPVLIVMALLGAFNMWSWWRMQKPEPIGDAGLFFQLFIDIAALSALLYLMGGATNPFVSLYLPALAVAAAILPWRLALILAIVSLAAYSAMMSHYIPLHVMDHEMAMSYHLVGMWINFALSAGLITWFVGRRSRLLREKDAQLALAREQHLKNEQMIALGTQAASAAHEMGTPLSTIALIAGDLKHDSARNAELAAYREDIATIETQIALCKASLDRMGGAAGGEAAPPDAPVALENWLAQFIEKWRVRCPATQLKLASAANDARIRNAPDLGQILLILLDNAAHAASRTDTPVSVALSVATNAAVIRVEDQGPGISTELLKRLGSEQVASASGGQGIGLMLAFATARQIGARMTLSSEPGAGTTATVTIPLHEA